MRVEEGLLPAPDTATASGGFNPRRELRRVQASGFRVQEVRVWGLGFRGRSQGYRVSLPRARKVDIRLPGKGDSNSDGARPVY